MIEVISKPSKQRVQCGKCKAVLAYAYDDVQTNQCQYDYYTYIICPECNSQVKVDIGYHVPFWERDR